MRKVASLYKEKRGKPEIQKLSTKIIKIILIRFKPKTQGVENIKARVQDRKIY